MVRRQVLRKQRIDDGIGAGAVPVTVVGAENALPRKARPRCNALRRDILWIRMNLRAAKSHY